LFHIKLKLLRFCILCHSRFTPYSYIYAKAMSALLPSELKGSHKDMLRSL
jgi:hypothetical protein